jgi:hypothetical protein
MLDVSYPSLRAFVADCHRCGLYALRLILSHEYAIASDGHIYSVSHFN